MNDVMAETYRRINEGLASFCYEVTGGQRFSVQHESLLVNIDPVGFQIGTAKHLLRVFSLEWRYRYLEALCPVFEPLDEHAHKKGKFTAFFRNETTALFDLEEGIPYRFTLGKVTEYYPEAEFVKKFNRDFGYLRINPTEERSSSEFTFQGDAYVMVNKSFPRETYSVTINPLFPLEGAEMTLVNVAGDMEFRVHRIKNSFFFTGLTPGSYVVTLNLVPGQTAMQSMLEHLRIYPQYR